nr:uncharacterized protein CI109_004872 [Kwoniella shandongensis]KAA5526872.1 hypothetical protein CI109_004872 [Kwoniella shandongensis]
MSFNSDIRSIATFGSANITSFSHRQLAMGPNKLQRSLDLITKIEGAYLPDEEKEFLLEEVRGVAALYLPFTNNATALLQYQEGIEKLEEQVSGSIAIHKANADIAAAKAETSNAETSSESPKSSRIRSLSKVLRNLMQNTSNPYGSYRTRTYSNTSTLIGPPSRTNSDTSTLLGTVSRMNSAKTVESSSSKN